MLLRLGAHVVTCAEDVFRVFGDDLGSQKTSGHSKQRTTNLSPEEKKILACFGEDPVHIDTIAEQSCLDIRTINSTLGIMELKGFVKNVGQMKYIRNA